MRRRGWGNGGREISVEKFFIKSFFGPLGEINDFFSLKSGKVSI